MSYNIGEYTFIHSYHEGKKGYVNKFEKSLKLPFLNVLHNHMPTTRPMPDNETKIDDSDVAVSDNVELSSAVVGSSTISDTGVENT